MSDDTVAGAAVEEPLLLKVRGDRAAARLESEWRQAARTVLHALAHQETPAAPAELWAFAKAQDMGTATLRWSVCRTLFIPSCQNKTKPELIILL